MNKKLVYIKIKRIPVWMLSSADISKNVDDSSVSHFDESAVVSKILLII